MRIKTVAVEYGRKFNMGNYQSLDVKVTLWADIDTQVVPGESTAQPGELAIVSTETIQVEHEDAVIDALFDAAKSAVRKQFLMAKGKWPEPVEDEENQVYEDGDD